MGNNPSRFEEANRPVERVSWNDCVRFCNKLSKESGLKIELPTEAQWEYACRARTTSTSSFGSTLNGDKANCNGNQPFGTSKKGEYLGQTTVVKSYSPNAWGLYDMHGNVWEWCSDWYDYYDKSPTSDPKGPESSSEYARVCRGGCWSNGATCCRSAYRYGLEPARSGTGIGFRPLSVP